MPSDNRDTIATYDAVAARYLARGRDEPFEGPWLRSFAEAVPNGARVLDLGSGPGRDSSLLRELGLDPICVDFSIGMLRAGVSEYPNPRVQADMLRIPIRTTSVAGVWANASLLHLEAESLPEALSEISRVLVPSGTFYLSLKEGKGSRWESEVFDSPRWFQYWTATDLDRVLSTAGFRVKNAARAETSRDRWLIRECVAASPI